MNRVALLLLVGCGTLACGGDDDGDDSGAGGSSSNAGTFGTCDLKSVRQSCIESTGPRASIENQQEGCLDAGGSWTTSECPDDMLLGCCSYTFGLEFRECFYEGTASSDPEAYCATWDDGVWTPGP